MCVQVRGCIYIIARCMYIFNCVGGSDDDVDVYTLILPSCIQGLCVHASVCAHACMHACACASARMYVCVCVCVCVHACVYACMCVYA